MKHIFFALITTLLLAIFFISYAAWFLVYFVWTFKPYPFKKYATIKGEYVFTDINNSKDFFNDLFYLNK